MTERNATAVVGADSIAVESLVITLLSPFVFGLTTEWTYDLLFQLALGAVIVIMLVRVMAGKATDPNIHLIKRSLRWSAKLLQIALIGAIATASIHLSSQADVLHPVPLFAAIACTLSLGFALLDQLVLGEYAETWTAIIADETSDTVVGAVIRETAALGQDFIESVVNENAAPGPYSNLKLALLGGGLLSVLLLVTLPLWLVLAQVFGHWGIAALVVLSIVLLRDATRYIYLNYGAATSFTELKWPLKWEFLWTAVMGALLAGVAGYDLAAVL